MRRVLHLPMLLMLMGPAAIAQNPPAPKGRCAFNVKFDREAVSVKLPSGQQNLFLGGNVVATCPAQRIVLKSDSLEVYGDEGRYYFVGHVDYKEPRLTLKSDYLTYFQHDERLLAVLNVDALLPSGSSLKGNQLEFFRAIPKVRPQQRGIAVGRPTITLIERDAQGKPQPPATVTGNNVWLEGDSIVSSQGEVVVVRPELTATGDSLFLDRGAGIVRMMRKPRITGTKGRPFTLIGETIDLLSRRKKLDRVLAKNAAEATSQDLNLKADSIDLRMTDDLLQRAIAWGNNRARATSPARAIVSDSIDVLMPSQRVREIRAVRLATAEGAPDTLKFRTAEKDRLTGDTIIAKFDSVPARDTTAKPRIRELVSIGRATSLQHLAPPDTTCHLPAINYVRGRLITVAFDSARVSTVRVTDPELAGGIYVEPCAAPARAAGGIAVPPGTPPPSGAAGHPLASPRPAPTTTPVPVPAPLKPDASSSAETALGEEIIRQP